jgi:hypothetical protein
MQIAANPDAKASNKPNRRTLIELSYQLKLLGELRDMN